MSQLCTDDCYDLATYCNPDLLRRHANYCPNHPDYDRHMALKAARDEVDMVDVDTGLAKLLELLRTFDPWVWSEEQENERYTRNVYTCRGCGTKCSDYRRWHEADCPWDAT